MKLTKKEQYMEKKIAIVRLHRGVLDPITQVNKLMTFICDIEDVKKGDFVVVELSMKHVLKISTMTSELVVLKIL